MYAMLYNRIKAAPVWDAKIQDFVGNPYFHDYCVIIISKKYKLMVCADIKMMTDMIDYHATLCVVGGVACIVVSGVRRMNEVNARRARLVSGWVTLQAGILSRYVTSQLGQLSLASIRVARLSTSFGWGKGGNVTCAGWHVTLCDPMWHVSSRSCVAIL